MLVEQYGGPLGSWVRPSSERVALEQTTGWIADLSVQPKRWSLRITQTTDQLMPPAFGPKRHWLMSSVRPETQRLPKILNRQQELWSLHMVGNVAITVGAFKVAQSALSQLIVRDTNNWHAMMELAKILADNGHHQEAASVLRPVVPHLEQLNIVSAFSLGGAAAAIGDLELAKQAWEYTLNVKGTQATQGIAEGGMAPGMQEALRCQVRALLGDGLAGCYTPSSWSLTPFRLTGSARLASDGSLQGRHVLVCTTGGLGDRIQGVRYLPALQEQGAIVHWETPPALWRLFAGTFGEEVLVHTKDLSGMSLYEDGAVCVVGYVPQVPAGAPESLVSYRNVPYLRADAGPSLGSDRHIGIRWVGSTAHSLAPWRNIANNDLDPLFAVSGVKWHSLQVKSDNVKVPKGVIDHSDELLDFADTARLISQMDLVITVDTSIAHLSAALGRPTWTWLYASPDSRWGLMGDRTPWYPTMRLFRQLRRGEWAPAVAEVGAKLRKWAAPCPA